MTETKILKRLAAFGPPIIDRGSKPTGGHCVLATRVGIMALRHFGIQAQPLPVRLVIHNAVVVALLERVREPSADDWAAAKAAGGWTVDVGHPEAPGDGWTGHLVVHVPTHQLLMDLDLGQYARPTKQIKVCSGQVFSWPHGTEIREWPLPGGGILAIKEEPFNQTYLTARDWNVYDDDPLVQDVVRAMRKGRV